MFDHISGAYKVKLIVPGGHEFEPGTRHQLPHGTPIAVSLLGLNGVFVIRYKGDLVLKGLPDEKIVGVAVDLHSPRRIVGRRYDHMTGTSGHLVVETGLLEVAFHPMDRDGYPVYVMVDPDHGSTQRTLVPVQPLPSQTFEFDIHSA